MKNRAILLTLLLALAGFSAGLVRLFLLRFESGDAYPAGSSLRADPLGARAYREALALQGGRRVRPGFEPVEKRAAAPPATLFVLGVGARDLLHFPAAAAADLEATPRAGGRLVVALLPVADPKDFAAKEPPPSKKESPNAKAGREEDPAPPEPEDVEEEPAPPALGPAPRKEPEPRPAGKGPHPRRAVALGARWGFELEAAALPGAKEGAPPVGSAEGPRGVLGEPVSWHSCLVFAKLRPEWRVVLSRGGRPVLIERDFAGGTIVLATDSWFLSNEALRRERRADLLAWLAGPHAEVVFDETHLGVKEDPGVATLVRKYRLHGAVLGLLLLAALFVWQNFFPLVPPPAAAGGGAERAEGRDHASGLVSLLRRSLPPAGISRTCLEEWARSSLDPRRVSRGDEARIRDLVAREQALPPGQRNPIQTYNRISQILAERK